MKRELIESNKKMNILNEEITTIKDDLKEMKKGMSYLIKLIEDQIN